LAIGGRKVTDEARDGKSAEWPPGREGAILPGMSTLFTTVTETTRKAVDELLWEHGGMADEAGGPARTCRFESAKDALSMVERLREMVPDLRMALGQEELREELVKLQALAETGETLATDSFLRTLPDGTAFFERVQRGSNRILRLKPRAKKDTKEMFDFSRAEHERIQEVGALRRPDLMAPDLRMETIPLAVEPKFEATTPSKVSRVSMRQMERERLRKNLRSILLLGFFFIFLLPALFFGFWWMVGTKQAVSMGPAPEEIERKVKDSDLIRMMETKRPKGVSPADIARGNVPIFGTVTIKTTPEKAEVYIAGKKIPALTPVKVREVRAGQPMEVIVKKAGYADGVQLISLEPNEEKTISIRLERSQ